MKIKHDVVNEMGSAIEVDLEKIEWLRQNIHRLSKDDLNQSLVDLRASLQKTHELFRIKEFSLERTLEKWLMLKNDLSLARQVQNTLYPKENIYLHNFQLAGLTQAALSLGGDYYAYNISNTGINACIGDVSGKGIANALMTIMFDSQYKNLIYQEFSLKDVLCGLNQYFTGVISEYEGLERKFMTFVAFRYMGKIEYAGAGHEYLLIYRASQKNVEVIKTGGVALGLLSTADCFFSSGEIDLQPGDCLVTYTDGVTEARNAEQQQYGQLRLIEQIRLNHSLDPESLLKKILADVTDFQGEHEQYDDITLLAIKYPEA